MSSSTHSPHSCPFLTSLTSSCDKNTNFSLERYWSTLILGWLNLFLYSQSALLSVQSSFHTFHPVTRTRIYHWSGSVHAITNFLHNQSSCPFLTYFIMKSKRNNYLLRMLCTPKLTSLVCDPLFTSDAIRLLACSFFHPWHRHALIPCATKFRHYAISWGILCIWPRLSALFSFPSFSFPFDRATNIFLIV